MKSRHFGRRMDPIIPGPNIAILLGMIYRGRNTCATLFFRTTRRNQLTFDASSSPLSKWCCSTVEKRVRNAAIRSHTTLQIPKKAEVTPPRSWELPQFFQVLGHSAMFSHPHSHDSVTENAYSVFWITQSQNPRIITSWLMAGIILVKPRMLAGNTRHPSSPGAPWTQKVPALPKTRHLPRNLSTDPASSRGLEILGIAGL